MINLDDEILWLKIKTDVLNHIPRIPSGYDYAEWFRILANIKTAGYSKEEAHYWCGENGEPQNSTWKSIKDEDGNKAASRGFLLKIAKQHGFTLDTHTGEDATLISAKEWLKEKSDNPEFCAKYLDELSKNGACNEDDNSKANEVLLKEYISDIHFITPEERKAKTYKIFTNKKEKSGKKTLEVNEKEVYRWLTDSGYITANYNGKLVNARLDGHLVKRLNWDLIFAELNTFILNNHKDKIDTWIKHSKFYNEHYFRSLPHKKISLHTDESKAAYFYFRNGILEVNAANVNLMQWEDFNGYIWADTYKSLEHDFNANGEKSQFETFFELVAGSDQRKKVLMTLFGYYLHRYKNQGDIHCLYLTDKGTDIDIQSSKGGTGKGTFFKGVEQLRDVLSIDCKTEDINGRFALSDYADGTSVILYDDVQKSFDPNMLFVKISGVTTIEKKGVDVIKIPFEKSPKYGLTSNFVLRGMNSESALRRYDVFELDNFFSSSRTIYDYFGNNFFNGEWSAEEWNRFYTFAVKCLQLYFREGVLRETNNEFKIKSKLLESDSFKNFAEDYIIKKLNTQKHWSNKELYGCYLDYCRSNLVNSKYVLSLNTLGAKMLEFFAPGCKRERNMNERGFYINPDEWDLAEYYNMKKEDKEEGAPF